jgi:hypothetical protein
MTDADIDSACLSYRHDFGLLSKPEKDRVRFECREWEHAISKARPSPKVRKLVWHNGESKGGGAKYNMYEVRDGLFNCVVYPHEDTQYRIAEKVSDAKAIEAANADYEARILGALE